MRLIRIATALLFAGVLAAACNVTSPSDLMNEPPCTSTLAPGGSAYTCQVFSTNKTGEFIVKVTALSPDSGATLLISYGQPSSGGCGVLGQNVSSFGNTVFDFSLPKGSYCIVVAESPVFPLQRAETFTLTISHL